MYRVQYTDLYHDDDKRRWVVRDEEYNLVSEHSSKSIARTAANELNKDLLVKVNEAFNAGYLARCKKCDSYKISYFVDENYFYDPLRCECQDCNTEWSGCS